MNKAVPALLAAALALAGCGRSAPEAAPPLAGARIGGPFTLTDQDGRRFSSDRLRGRYAVVYFGYTFCPDACPTAMQVLAKAVGRLPSAQAARLQTVFVSVDPARDTPPVVRQFVRAFSPTLIGLTGSEAEIAAAAKEYAVAYSRERPAAGTSGYLMQHQTVPILFAPDGKPVVLVPVDQGPDAVAATLRQWIA